MIFHNKKLRKYVKRYIGKDNIPYKLLEEPFFYIRPSKKGIASLKNKYKGQRCVVIGNGPSLNKLDLNRIKSIPSFGVNGIFYKTDEMGFKPTFYVVEDSHVMKENVDRINSYDVPYKFFPIDYKGYIKNKSDALFFRMNTGFYQETSPNYCVPRFSTDASERLYCGQSVTMINLQLAFYLGFESVYLIGMDFDYQLGESDEVNGNDIVTKGSDINHFHPDYFGKGKTWHDPHLDRVLASYKYMKIVYELFGRKIFNATEGGKLEVFDRVSFHDVF